MIGGILAPNDGLKGAPRLKEAVGFDLALVPDVLNELPFLTKLLFCFSITTVFFPWVLAISIFLIDFFGSTRNC